MTVVELMKTHIVKISPDASLQDAVDMFDLYQLTSLPVVDSDGFPLGLVTEHRIASELIPGFIANSGMSTSRHEEPGKGGIAVRDLMITPPLVVDENVDVLDAAKIMNENDLERLPVTTEGRVIGTISRIDICQAILEGHS